jgi:hypothetical protein
MPDGVTLVMPDGVTLVMPDGVTLVMPDGGPRWSPIDVDQATKAFHRHVFSPTS